MKKKPTKPAHHSGQAKSAGWQLLRTIPCHPFPTSSAGYTTPPVAAAPPRPPQPDVRPNEDTFIRAMRDIATAAWKLKGIVFKPGSDEAIAVLDEKQLADIGFYAERLYNTLATLGVIVFDYTGQDFSGDMPVKVISAKPAPSLEKEIVFQTILPTLRFGTDEFFKSYKFYKFYPGNVVTLRPVEEEQPAEEVIAPAPLPATATEAAEKEAPPAAATVSASLSPSVAPAEAVATAPPVAGQPSLDKAAGEGTESSNGGTAAGKDS